MDPIDVDGCRLGASSPDNVVNKWELKFVEVYPEYATLIVNKLCGRREVNEKQLCPEEQMEFDLADAEEWNSVLNEKSVLRILTTAESFKIRREHPVRISGARWFGRGTIRRRPHRS